MKEINVVQIGCGKMSRYTMRYLLDKGCNLLGAFDINEKIIGKSINSIYDEVNSKVLISNISDLDLKLKELKPNVAIVETTRLLQLILLQIYSLPFLNKGFIMSTLYVFELCIFMYRVIILS